VHPKNRKAPLGEEWTTLDQGNIGWMGFRDSIDPVQLWITLHPNTRDMEGTKSVISPIFNDIVWTDTTAVVTLKKLPRDPQGQLRCFATQIDAAVWRWEMAALEDAAYTEGDPRNAEQDPDEEPPEEVEAQVRYHTEKYNGHRGYE